jgi:hypothetical protein
MSGKGRVDVGQLNSYIPTAKGSMKEEQYRFLSQAAWRIPKTMHRFAVHLDGSNWLYPLAYHERAKKIKEQYDGKYGIRIYLSNKVTWDDEEELWRAIRDAVSERLQGIGDSLRESLQKLSQDFDSIDLSEGDGRIVDRVTEAKKKLKELSFVIASFSITDDFDQAREAVEKVIECELERARIELWKRNKAIQDSLSRLHP